MNVQGSIALALAAGLAVTIPAYADDSDSLAKPVDEQASEHLTQGNRHYRLREFDKAVEQFKAGALAEDAPVFLYNLAQSYRQLGQYEDAIWHYERFLTRAQPTGQLRTAIEGFLVEMRAVLARRTPASATASGTGPAPQPIAPATEEGTTAIPSSEPAPIDGPSGMSTRRKLAIGAGAVGLAAIGVGVVFGLRAKGFEDDAAELCPMTECERAGEANALLERGQTNATYANIGFGVGAVAAIGAAVLWFTGSSSTNRTALVPTVSSQATGFAFTTRF